MAKFLCTVCNYQFEPKSTRTPTRCPYCGRNSIEPVKQVQDLLDESDISRA